MKKPVFIPFACGRCELQFGILKEDYNPRDTYYCPLCRVDRVASLMVEKAKKKVRPRQTFNKTIVGREL
jgi:hypothetical protein